ncbi:hypothetical protein Cgig2_009095 [Carnegiea gigantea]|uniref:RNase H type-1 domain-containing protein n=1 Tax=Carnegiea gigantea TaxID=171969 RepID=A0A9Q1QGK2_9CARY|nr:hypothetical protein Cgig2_009095 [Carnegiea gigantea]
MRQSNSAFLTKLGWRVLTEKGNLWSRVLRAKYCSGRCDIDMFTPRTDASNAWKEILECAKFLKEGAKTEIDNPLYNSCHNVKEDVLHLLRDCQHARRVWLELVMVPEIKLLALLHGLRMAKAEGITQLIVQLDSKVVIDKLEKVDSSRCEHYFIIQEYRKLVLDGSWRISLTHCFREANRAANSLANLGVNQSPPIIFFDYASNFMYSVLLEDIDGVAWPRQVRT